MNKNLKDRDILLVREKGSSELHATGTDKDGKVKSAKLNDGENPDFLKIDKRGNILENFFENFMRQVKNPTRFEFFRVPAEKFNEIVQKLQGKRPLNHVSLVSKITKYPSGIYRRVPSHWFIPDFYRTAEWCPICRASLGTVYGKSGDIPGIAGRLSELCLHPLHWPGSSSSRFFPDFGAR